MTRLVWTIVLVLSLVAGAVAPVRGQTTRLAMSATRDQRADALIGLGRVARARGDWREAHARFVESERVRAFGPPQLEEHFWIAVHADREAALRIAANMASRQRASRDVFVRWIALVRDTEAPEAVLRVVDQATAAFPGDVEWTRTRATIALRAERDRRDAVAALAWGGVPARDRESNATWHASFLRVSAALSSRASLASEFDRYVRAHPDDTGTRLMAVEAWADAGQPVRGLELLAPLLGRGASAGDLRRAADLARQGGDDARARALLVRLVESGRATAADTWTLADLLAAAHDSQALRRLLGTAATIDQPCRERLIGVATAAGDDALLADLVPSLSPGCRIYADAATRIAAVLLARGRPADAERWLEPLARRGALDDPGRLVLARALAARRAWPEVDSLLSGMVVGRDDVQAREAAVVLVWAWHAQSRSVEAWRVTTRLLTPFADDPAAQAGWAAMALAAGDRASASRLADAALGSAREVDARAVHAALAAQDGYPREVLRWLEPVRTELTDPGHVLILLDAVDALDGPAAATAAAEAHAALFAGDASLLSRRATWAASMGDAAGAAADAAQVRALDPAQADRLDVALALAGGDGDAAWTRMAGRVEDESPADRVAWQRLRLDAALATRRWDEAEHMLAGSPGTGLTDSERTLAAARLRLGRDGKLGGADRAALALLVESGRHVRPATVLLAADDVGRRAYAEALARLPITPGAASAASAPADVRAVAAEALLGLGRAADVMRLIPSTDATPAGLLVLRARAQVAVGQVSEGRAALEQLARTTGRAEAYRAWEEVLDTPEGRATVLGEAVTRHPDDQDLRVRYVQALRMAGDLAAARVQAETVLRQAPDSRVAWGALVAVDAAAAAPGLAPLLGRARAALGGDPDTVLMLLEAAAQAPQLPDEVVDVAAEWLAGVPESHALAAARLQATLAVSAGRWPMAEAAIERLTQLAPDDTTVMRLRAEVTAWSGAHEAAVPLFAAYLEREPADVAAWRQYARLLTWRDDRAGAEQAYARAQALSPDLGTAAEARTRLAVLQRAWPDAASAAAEWRALEPAALDALVDLALALEQAGDAAGASRAYADLARWPGLPDSVQRTLSAFEWRRAPHADFDVELERADGFGGQRLVERRETALGADTAVTRDGAVRIAGRFGQGHLDTGPTDTTFTQGQAAVRASLGRGLSAQAHLGATGTAAGDALLGGVQVGVRLSRSVGLEVASARRPFWENEATVTTGMQAWTSGVRLRLLGLGPVVASGGADYTRLSDGNGRQQADVSVGRQVERGPGQLEVRASAFVFGFSESSPAYFSPAAFGRLDVEVGLARWYGRGAVVRDGRFVVRGRIGSGVDTDGVPYLLGSGSVVMPIGGRLALAGDARLTASRTYRAWSGTVGLRVGSGGGVRSSRTR